MLTSFVLAMAIAAPVPPAAPPVPSGPAPRVLELKPDADGKIMIAISRTETLQAPGAVNAAAPGGAAVAPANVSVVRAMTVELSEVKELKVTTADGTKLDTAEALKRLARGGVVVVSADGKPVSPNFLNAFKDDVLVLASPELASGAFARPGGVLRPGLRPQPAPIAVPVQPGVVQIQIQPAVQLQPAQPPVVQVLPAPPAPAPRPEK